MEQKTLLNSLKWLTWVQFSSVAQSCPTPCDPMNHSTPGLPVHHQPQSLPKLMSIEMVMPPNSFNLCHPLLLLPSIFPNIRSFQMSQLFALGGQNTGVSASTSVFPMNIQDWSPLGWTAWISLQSKGLKSLLEHHSSKASILQCSGLFIVQLSTHDYWKKHYLD